DISELFVEALEELRVPLPSPLEAADCLKRHYAAKVVAGELPPREGARLIVQDVLSKVDHLRPSGAYVGESFGVAQLVGYFYNYDDVSPNDNASISVIDRAIVQECERISVEKTA
ncbi:MAG: hypothetical protein K8J08_02655, partial [Thermoanaerobaculia bacterium]|nr:hypothetical protein [Thermoanaerobaculia bacterium]